MQSFAAKSYDTAARGLNTSDNACIAALGQLYSSTLNVGFIGLKNCWFAEYWLIEVCFERVEFLIPCKTEFCQLTPRSELLTMCGNQIAHKAP